MISRDELKKKFGKEHLSYSSLKYALGDMKNFELYMKGELKFESAALEFGTMYDMLLFEPEKAHDTYATIDDHAIMEKLSDKARMSKKPKLTSEYKAHVAALKTEALENGKTLVEYPSWKQALDMIERLKACGLHGSHLKGKYQVEFNTELHGVPVKGFLDCLGDDYISDSKSTMSVKKFKYSVRDFNYDIQAYIYTQVFDIKKFYWVVQEKSKPYTPALVECSDSTLFSGEMNFFEAMRKIRRYLNEGDDYDPTTEYMQFEV